MKNLLRTKAKSTRKFLNCEAVSRGITEQILNWDIYHNAANIMLYHPIGNEINLLGLCKDSSKHFYLPKIENNDICIASYSCDTDMKCGKFNIQEPCEPALQKTDLLDIVFMPALMVDKWGYRLGYGKGYYDRFIEKLAAKTILAVPIYNELYCEELPVESHDKAAHFIILKDKIEDVRLLLA